MSKLTTDLDNATENIKTHAVESEQLLVNNEEPESSSNGHKTSDSNNSRTTEHQSLLESPNLNDQLTTISNDFGTGSMQASKDNHMVTRMKLRNNPELDPNLENETQQIRDKKGSTTQQIASQLIHHN